MFDCIIVGQGLAGSLLSWFLLQEGQNVLVIDHYSPSSASNIASGIINPITGKRFVKTWLADELIPVAENTYQFLEEKLSSSFFHPIPIIKLFDSVRASNDWSGRCATPEYGAYLRNERIVHLDTLKVKNDFGGFEISGGRRLDTAKFLSAYRHFISVKNLLVEEKFQPDKLKEQNGYVEYGELKAHKIIFCEGAHAITNPYFRFLPFQLAKGECLIVEVPDFYRDSMIIGEAFILPEDAKDTYYVGATHDWNFHDALPSETGKNELEGNLQALLNAPYKIIDQKAAIRPTVKDRRPFVGFHPEHPSIGIFNGMGTKGVSLAPYFARHFADHIVHNKSLMAEVDIHRFL